MAFVSSSNAETFPPIMRILEPSALAVIEEPRSGLPLTARLIIGNGGGVECLSYHAWNSRHRLPAYLSAVKGSE